LDYSETIHQIFIVFEKAYDWDKGEVLYNILIEFGVPMKLVTLIKMCLNETYSKFRIGKYLCDEFPFILWFFAIAFQIFFRTCHYERPPKEREQEGLELNGARQLLVYGCDFNLVRKSINT